MSRGPQAVAAADPPSRLVVDHAMIVTADDADRIVRGHLIVEHGVITAVQEGPAPELLAGVAETRVDAAGAVVLPGFVNAHAHLSMSLLRGVADGTDLDGFLATVLPLEAALLDPEFVAAGAAIAAAECLRSGITSALDMYFFPESVLAECERLGLRLHTGPAFIGFRGADGMDFAERADWARRWMLRPPSSVGSMRWLQPHSTYLLSELQLRAIASLADETGARVHVHAAETRAEIAQVASLHGGRTPIQVLADVGLLHDRTVLAHAVHLTDHDIELIARHGAHVVHNPASNAKLGSGLCRVKDLLDAGVNVALGTDGAASANDLDLLVAMRLACYLPGAVTGDPSAVTAADAIAMATRNGARALGVDDTLGTLSVGRRADFVVLRPGSADRAPHLLPEHDPRSATVFAATRAEIDSVFVGGVCVVAGGIVQRVDPALGRRLERAMGRLSEVRT